jgi:Protein of unknown function (DUF3616)
MTIVRILHAIALAAVLLLATADARAEQDKLTPVATQWDVRTGADGEAPGKQARANVSGAACTSTEPPFRSCLIANDEKKYAQLFTVDGTTIVLGARVALRDKDADGDPDAEGVAFADGYFYVVGSHGRSRHHDKDHNPSSYVVFRFPVDAQTGRPASSLRKTMSSARNRRNDCAPPSNTPRGSSATTTSRLAKAGSTSKASP